MAESIDGTGLVQYDAMVLAIVKAERADEAKEIKDQARALQIYFQQSKNYDNEKRAATLRIRATRRMGQILKATEKNNGAAARNRPAARGHGGGPHKDTGHIPTLKAQGITKNESAQAQRLADIPEVEFEQQLEIAHATDKVPSVGGILEGAKKTRETIRQVTLSQEVVELLALLRAIVDFDVEHIIGVDFVTQIEIREVGVRAMDAIDEIIGRAV